MPSQLDDLFHDDESGDNVTEASQTGPPEDDTDSPAVSNRITFEKTIKYRKYSVVVCINELSFSNGNISMADIAETLDNFIDEAILDSKLGGDPRFCITLRHPGLREKAFHLPARTRSTINGVSIVNQLTCMMNSNDLLSIDGNFFVQIYLWPDQIATTTPLQTME